MSQIKKLIDIIEFLVKRKDFVRKEVLEKIKHELKVLKQQFKRRIGP